MSSTVSTVVGARYELGDLLGSGGMADVFRARDLVLERDVAVKVMRATSAGATERARFADEARTLASLNHHGLVTIMDAGIEAEHPYLVMGLVEGRTLTRAIADDGPLEQAVVAQIGVQLAEALAYAHESGVVHRDVKPGNILLRPDHRVVLTDFGIARLLNDVEHHTGVGETIGSPGYLAPEQVTGDPVTCAVDVYALGLVLLEALSGVRAYPGPAVEAAIARLSTPPVIPVSLGKSWRELLQQMTDRDPAARPSAEEVAVRLSAIDTGTAVLLLDPEPEPELAVASSWLRLRTAVVAGGVLAVTVVALLIAAALSGSDPSPAAAKPPAQVKPSTTTDQSLSATAAAATTAVERVAPVVKPRAAVVPKPAAHRPVAHAKAHGKKKHGHK